MNTGKDSNERSKKLSIASATSKDISEELSLWNQICNDLLNLYNLHKETEFCIQRANRINEKVNEKFSGKPDLLRPSIAKKLIESYNRVIEKATKEQKEIARTKDNLDILIALQNASDSGLEHKRKKRKMDKYMGSSKIKSHDNKQYKPLPKGNLVVVRPPGQDWLLASILQYFPDKNKYEVEDVEEEEDTKKKPRYIFPVKCVLEIPTDVDKKPYYPKGHEVLSLYPNSSCFYKATVVKTPNEHKNSSDGKPAYIVRFEDDDEAEREVPADRVLDMPPKMKIKMEDK